VSSLRWRLSVSSSRWCRRCCTALASRSRSCPLPLYVTTRTKSTGPALLTSLCSGCHFPFDQVYENRRQWEGVGDRARSPIGVNARGVAQDLRLSGSRQRSVVVRRRIGPGAGITRASGPGMNHSCPGARLAAPWSASAASTLRVCLYACRVISGSLSGLSPYDRD
jgi:hypothetical protein